MGVAVRVDRSARASEQRNSLIRALTGVAFSSVERSAAQYVEKHWRNDTLASLVTKRLDITERDPNSGNIVTKNAVSPMTIEESGLPVVVGVNVLPLLAPKSAATRLFAICRRVSLDTISRIFFPRIDYDPAAVKPIYVGEGKAMPVVTRSVTGSTLEAPKKILVGFAVSEEMELAGPEAATDFIAAAIEVDITRTLDVTTFDFFVNVRDGNGYPVDSVRPDGLLAGLTTLAASTDIGLAGINADIGTIVAKISGAGVSTDGMVIVCNDVQANSIKTLVWGSKFDYEVIGSPMIPLKRIIGIVPSCVVSGYSGVPQMEKSTNAAVHMVDTSPATDLAGAVPVVSASQAQLIVVKLRCWSSFAKVAPGIAYIDNVSW